MINMPSICWARVRMDETFTSKTYGLTTDDMWAFLLASFSSMGKNGKY